MALVDVILKRLQQYAVFVVLIAIAVLHYIYITPWISSHVSPALPALWSWLYFAAVVSFVRAAYTDPGSLKLDAEYIYESIIGPNVKHLNEKTAECFLNVKSSASFSSEGELVIIPLRYCWTCKFWKPPRTHHCGRCNKCIDHLDHHCKWLNNCVGSRNYRYFFAFVSLASILGLFLAGQAICILKINARDHAIGLTDSIREKSAVFALLVIGLAASIYPLALTVYHIYLMSRAQSTLEFYYV
ncbi:DHHC palmitoyltransferase-domain-containing protein [Dipodascopsis uninucleata]